MIYDKNLIISAEDLEETTPVYSDVMEFEFDGFSVVIENGVWGVQYEDAEEGLVIQYLVDEGGFSPKFPYLFMVDDVEKVLSEEDYLKIKTFLEKSKEHL